MATKHQATPKVKDKIKDVLLNEQAAIEYKEYGVATIEDRAIVGGTDGLKPVLRRILWAMRQLGLNNSHKHVKAALVVGECFVSGTQISTPSGDVDIENIEVGDKVLHDHGADLVTRVFEIQPREVMKLTLADGTTLTATEEQVFYVVDAEGNESEKALKDLKPGDKIKCI
jgi:preprotein translocase subunit YajC